jgi:hypothetical protein
MKTHAHHAGAAHGSRSHAAAQGSSKVDAFLANAMKFLGQPYRYAAGHGATYQGVGPVDCSGLVCQAAAKAGINLKGSAAMLQKSGPQVPLSKLQPGDLVFVGNPAHHVGIYIGNGKVLESPHTGDQVKIVPLQGYGWTSACRPSAFGGQAGKPLDGLTSSGSTSLGRVHADANAVGGGQHRSSLGLATPMATFEALLLELAADGVDEQDLRQLLALARKVAA